MKANKNNPCAGRYGESLDVKFTNECNGSCSFCIERGGHRPQKAPVKKLIASTKNTKVDNILILGGEPLISPDLVPYLEGVKPLGKKIYITTNGTLLTPKKAEEMAPYIDGINISLHHFTEEGNFNVVGAPIHFRALRESIAVFKRFNVSVRINTNLVIGGIDTYDKAVLMLNLAIELGATNIRFAELQNCEDSFVDARDVFGPFINLPDNPFTDGCEQNFVYHDEYAGDIPVIVRLTCGLVNGLKPAITKPEGRCHTTHVMYADGRVYGGWIKPKNDDEEEEDDDVGDCHPPIVDDDCHHRVGDGGCNSFAVEYSGCNAVPLKKKKREISTGCGTVSSPHSSCHGSGCH